MGVLLTIGGVTKLRAGIVLKNSGLQGSLGGPVNKFFFCELVCNVVFLADEF